jgi:hypothetical protein
MKVKNSTLFATEGIAPFVSGLNALIAQKLPIKSAFAVAKLSNDAAKAIKDFEDARIAIFKRLGEEKDGKVEIKPENREEFFKSLSELLELEQDIPGEPIPVPETCELTAAQADALKGFINVA